MAGTLEDAMRLPQDVKIAIAASVKKASSYLGSKRDMVFLFEQTNELNQCELYNIERDFKCADCRRHVLRFWKNCKRLWGIK